MTIQAWLPGGPLDRYLTTPMTPDLAANTALSFSTTTTWQVYGGETTLRYLIQVVGLATQNFLAGAAGLAVGVAFIRGFAREQSATLGNFWVDLVRALLWVLLPLSLVGSVVLVWQGVPLNAAPYIVARTLEGREQVIAQGPVAAVELIKNLGTNGGGFFNANGAHPYENPTPLTNFIALLAIAVLPASFPITFGVMVGRPRAGWALPAVMVVLFVAGLTVCDLAERSLPPQRPDHGGAQREQSILQSDNDGRHGGRPVRSGRAALALAGRFATQTRKPETIGSMPCDTPTFGVLVLGSVVLLGALCFLPALVLGPIAEHLHP